MLEIRKSKERGLADHGWLKSMHTFSFANYYDPKHMGFRALRVINEDRIEGGTGFGKHSHKDMEIISYVIKGSLQHEDSMGTKAVIRPGEVQRMSAGSGILHSEMNNEAKSETHFFQIWIQPSSSGGAPGYGQKSFEDELTSKNLVLVISPDGRDGSIEIKQNADMYISRLKAQEKLSFQLRSGRGAWIQIVRGKMKVGNLEVETGDAVSIENEAEIAISALESSEFILFDLAQKVI